MSPTACEFEHIALDTDPSIARRLSCGLVLPACHFHQPAPSMCRYTHGTLRAGAGYPASGKLLLPSAASFASASRPGQCRPSWSWSSSPHRALLRPAAVPAAYQLRTKPNTRTPCPACRPYRAGTVFFRLRPLRLHSRGSTARSSLVHPHPDLHLQSQPASPS
jgi:hypothetical protein